MDCKILNVTAVRSVTETAYYIDDFELKNRTGFYKETCYSFLLTANKKLYEDVKNYYPLYIHCSGQNIS